MISSDFKRQLAGYGLTTANILYHRPDHPKILQTYIWQDYDMAPKFPKLIKFLDFWSHNLDGPLATIRVAQAGLVAPALIPGSRPGAAEPGFADWQISESW